MRTLAVGDLDLAALSVGAGPDVVLLHGLGLTGASFAHTVAALCGRWRVHVLDLPGFGASSKPADGTYDPPWFARAVLGAMDALGIERAHLVGNSLGGRVAVEVGLRAPGRVAALALLCPAVAVLGRDPRPLSRVLPPELRLLPSGLIHARARRRFLSTFCGRRPADPVSAAALDDGLRRTCASPAARLAFLASVRNVYLEPPFGASGFYPRLAALGPPALFVWAGRDRLVPATCARHVSRWLPAAEQVVIDSCGHLPQLEQPAQVNRLIAGFLTRATTPARGRARSRGARA